MNSKHKPKQKIREHYRVLGLLLFLYLLSDSLAVRAQGLQSQIPATEYSALIDLYNATGGPDWILSLGWLDPNAPLWEGVEVLSGHVTTLRFYSNSMSGSIPASLGNLSQLQFINFGANHLSGPIPESLGKLSQLKDLYLSGNELSGSIPESLGKLSQLNSLALSYNQLTGSIPASLSNLSQLRDLSLDDNQLSGNIPGVLAFLLKLQALSLGNNQLSGNIPASLGNLSQLQALLLNNNQLSGSIPPSLGNLSKLDGWLDLSANQLSGSIPESLGNLSLLQHYLHLQGNQLSGNIPVSLGNLSQLQELNLGANQLSGSIPANLGNLSQLQSLDLRGNQLNGGIPESLNNLSRLKSIDLGINQLSGSIPAILSNLSQLKSFSLDHNELSGTIPESFGNLSQLLDLSFANNQLSGKIPESLGTLSSLRSLELDHNGFEIDPGTPNRNLIDEMVAAGKQVVYEPQEQLQPLRIAPIPDRTVTRNSGQAQINITLTGASSTNVMSLMARSDNSALLPDYGMRTFHAGSNWLLLINPSPTATGETLITITAKGNSGEMAQASFKLTVLKVNMAPTIDPILNLTPPATLFVPIDSGVQEIPLTGITSGAPDEEQTVKISASNSNAKLITGLAVDYTSPNREGVLRFAPASGQIGSTSIKLTLTDDGGTADGGTNSYSLSFNVSVVAPGSRTVITRQPQSQVIASGNELRLEVETSRLEPFTCQWFKNGKLLPSMTNNPLVIKMATPLDSGNYNAKMVNGSLLSSIARVEVTNSAPLVQPIAATGWNSDRVLENIPWADAAAFDIPSIDGSYSGSYWFEAGYQGRVDGLPSSGIISSASNTNVVFALQPYITNNVLALEGTNSMGELVLVTPRRFSTISLLASSGGIGAIRRVYPMTLNFMDGTSETNMFIAPDWFSESANPKENFAIDGLARVSLDNGIRFDGGSDRQFSLHETDIDLVKLGLADRMLKTIAFRGQANVPVIGIFALSGAVSAAEAPRFGSKASAKPGVRWIGEEVELTVSSQPGTKLQLEESKDLMKWIEIGTTMDSPGEVTWRLQKPEGNSFFRVQQF